MASDPITVDVLFDPTPRVIEVVVPSSPEAVEVSLPGPQGPAGSAAQAHVHVQPVPAAEWVVNHNIGAQPLVQVLTAGGQVMVADVVHVSENQLRVYFAAPQAGSVRCM